MQEKGEKIAYSEVREIHEISKLARHRQVTIPRTLTSVLEVNDGDKIYWIKSQRKSHSPEIFDITIRVIHTQK